MNMGNADVFIMPIKHSRSATCLASQKASRYTSRCWFSPIKTYSIGPGYLQEHLSPILSDQPTRSRRKACSGSLPLNMLDPRVMPSQWQHLASSGDPDGSNPVIFFQVAEDMAVSSGV